MLTAKVIRERPRKLTPIYLWFLVEDGKVEQEVYERFKKAWMKENLPVIHISGNFIEVMLRDFVEHREQAEKLSFGRGKKNFLEQVDKMAEEFLG